MNINFGEHKGKSVTELVVNHPNYAKYVLDQVKAIGPLYSTQNEIKTLIGTFNSKPFIKKCHGQNCNQTATRCTAHRDDYKALYWWCDNCNPYQSGAIPGTIYILRTYEDILEYVQRFCQNRESDSIALIKQLMQEKGLPKRVKSTDIDKFFVEPGVLTF